MGVRNNNNRDLKNPVHPETSVIIFIFDSK